MSNFQEKATELFNQGYSCSESIVRAAYECGMIDPAVNIELLNKVASPFSGGMSSGCLCGAVAGAQIVLGTISGREDLSTSPVGIKSTAKGFIDSFKEKRKVTCCKALTAGYDFHSAERRQHCVGIVEDVAGVLENQISSTVKNTEASKA